jgi:hypothetical protein
MIKRSKIGPGKRSSLRLLSALSVFVLSGCVSENLDDCPVACRFTFSYTHNTSGKDLLAMSVGAIEVYMFDEGSDLLVDIIEVGPGDISRGRHDVAWMPPGSYTFVAWGVSGEDKLRSYHPWEMSGVTHGTRSEIEIGRTTLSDLYMVLNHEPSPPGLEGSVVPTPVDFDNVFHAMATDVEIVEGVSRQVDFEFIRNTSTLKIAVTGLEHFPDPPAGRLPLRIYATGENGRYGWNDEIDSAAPRVYYGSGNHRRTGNAMALDILMQRLHIARHTGDPVWLYIEQTTAGTLPNGEGASRPIPGIAPVDLVAAIKNTSDGMGYYPYKTQPSIDREEEFRITMALYPDPKNPGHYTMTMSINEWDVVILEPDIEEPNW